MKNDYGNKHVSNMRKGIEEKFPTCASLSCKGQNSVYSHYIIDEM